MDEQLISDIEIVGVIPCDLFSFGLFGSIQ